MAMDQNTVRLGKRDKFWLVIAFIVIAVFFVVRLLSHDGFSGPGKPVWKSAELGGSEQRDTSHSGHTQRVSKSSNH